MTINENENIIPVDIDETLVLSNWKEYPENMWMDIKYYDSTRRVVAHLEQIKLVKSYKARGFYVRVHSNNGYQWAAEVVKRLHLEPFVDIIETKPLRYVDDAIDTREVIGQRVYIEPEKVK